jgi:putative transposase
LEIPEDHIHIVIKGEPNIAPSHVMKVIKSISAREFFKLYPEIKKRYFWVGKLWTQSYFVETIGNANEEKIRIYVQNQLIELDNKEKMLSSWVCFKTRSLAADFFIKLIFLQLFLK